MKRLSLALAAATLCGAPAFAQSITVIQPNGGEVMCLGQTYQIRWVYSGSSTSVRPMLYKGGVKVANIVDATPAAAGIYNWNVGQTVAGMSGPGTDYTVWIGWGTASDTSNAPFTIKGAGQCGAVTPTPAPTTPTPTPTIDPGILQKIRELRAIRVKIPGGPNPPCRCPDFDMGSLLDLVSNPAWSPKLTFTVKLLKNGQAIANLGTLGRGQVMPRSVSPRLSEQDFALFGSTRGAVFQIGIFGANGMLEHRIGLVQ